LNWPGGQILWCLMSRARNPASPRGRSSKKPLARSPAPGPTRPFWRRPPVVLALIAVIGIAALELAARLYDSHRHYRFQLLKALDMSQAVNLPPVARPDGALEWPEGGLYVRDPEYNPPPDKPYVLGGKLIAEAQPDARQKFIRPDEVAAGKRVFVLGESAAFGYLVSYSNSFAGCLERALEPKGYRVLNAAQPGWASGMLVPVAHRILGGFQPEALILYLGNNEWINWFPPDQVPRQRLPKAARFLAHSRALAYGQFLLMNRMVERAHSPAARSEDQKELVGFDYALKHIMDKPPADWDAVKQSFLKNLESNLLSIIGQARARNVRVILFTAPFKPKLSPAWKHPQPLAFSGQNRPFVQQSLDDANLAYRKGEYARVSELLDPAIAREPAIALLHYVKAASLEAQGRFAEAEAEYALARENMVGNLGSILSINAVIRRVAAATGTDLVDVQALFDRYEHEQGRYFNQDLILDDCHPTPLGHRLIAEALVPVLLSHSQAPPATSVVPQPR
jgi:hypothetical protein